MKYFKTLLLFTFFQITFGILSFAQSPEQLLEEANTFYYNEQYREALNLFDKYIAQNKSNAEIYRKRGYSYAQLNQNEKAISDYKTSIKMEPDSAKAYYNLSSLYEDQENYDSAEVVVRTYIKLLPGDADGYAKLAYNLGAQGKMDSVIYNFEKGFSLDSTNYTVLYFLHEMYFDEGAYDKAENIAKIGKKVEPTDVDFYVTHGKVYLERHEFDLAIGQADSILQIDSSSVSGLMLNLRARMEKATDLSLMKDGDLEYFKKMRSANLHDYLPEIDTIYYNEMLAKIKAGEILGLDGYFKFYLAQSKHKNFSPYGTRRNEDINTYYKEDKYEALANESEGLFERHPFVLGDFYKVAIGNYAVGNYKEFTRIMAVYYGIVNAIMASGNGDDFENAMVVVCTADEYIVLDFLAYFSQRQSLMHSDGHAFDVLEAMNEFDEKSDFHFNVDIPFTSLSSTMKSNNDEKESKSEKSEGKKKKKKNKKKDK